MDGRACPEKGRRTLFKVKSIFLGTWQTLCDVLVHCRPQGPPRCVSSVAPGASSWLLRGPRHGLGCSLHLPARAAFSASGEDPGAGPEPHRLRPTSPRAPAQPENPRTQVARGAAW